MKYANLEWRDGQPYNPEFDDVYFSIDNGIEETEHVFIQHNQLLQRFTQIGTPHFVITETGFGSGLNFLVTVKHWLELSEPSCTLHFYSVENSPFSLQDLIQAHNSWPELAELAEELQQHYCAASYGFHSFDLFNGRVKLVLMIGDVETMLPRMQAKVDAWFLDGFAPGRNPDMWSETVFSHIKRLSKKGTTFSTYTAAGFVRRGLIEVGFDVEKVSGTGNKRHMITGRLNSENTLAYQSPQPWYENKLSESVNKQVTIIGAGLAGISSAWALVKRGFKVEIIEKGGQAGAQASGNPQGMLMPRLSLQDSAEAEFYISAYFYALRCLQLLDIEQNCWKQTGGIQLACSERFKKQIENFPQDSLLAQVLDAEEASEVSGLKIENKAHYFPRAACVYPKKILQIMIDEMGDALTITYNTDVKSIHYENQHWSLVNKKGEVVNQAANLILANAWQVKLFEQLDHLNLQPARGQISLYKANQQSRKLKLPLSFEGYLMPESDNQHVSGASFVVDDSETDIRTEEFQANLSDINLWFKDLFVEDDINGGRASVRAVTSDRVPVVGRVADKCRLVSDYADLHKGKPVNKYPLSKMLPGLYVNTGHGARGFTSAFLSSELLAAMICEESLPVSNRVSYALHSSRFLIRSLKKRRV
ncbi:MAG: bifunctional tRNA (5-methylaminomethyl-2-thiouridine)(34)-methyltransferase MnmD/FAD-dependent 5-carboxymethylaminomethyl-2-thiouridine(34) oxidoreductase MnmC [endosymbiont of Galathealinum brachiosum]|uniref:tRNA 5-methylaminomethyl-2-thiouridine biosynthesis bifunctional protein MnmC n=1 Tax=endosymbiont of Galathealinum brachiosum TaxID=2200906 RepID=A0A370DI22_9GAMM|nr:MAG: bifunctional tRNA (5-methylaminomethyl-2-thiouridine)(34)-methyltransferase MnmD/FAD-dependent 5-carboxymethylaminomethyl-2-thiouridine(34) oxidoreductase MnmC [endosymbiont of Galathealinum brachiosum]